MTALACGPAGVARNLWEDRDVSGAAPPASQAEPNMVGWSSGSGSGGLSMTPKAAREASARRRDAADHAEQGRAAVFYVDDQAQRPSGVSARASSNAHCERP